MVARIGLMPLFLRHLAAVLLPLASTTAGIVAVGVALHVPVGPPGRVAVPAAELPVGTVEPVVARPVPRPPPKPNPRAVVPQPRSTPVRAQGGTRAPPPRLGGAPAAVAAVSSGPARRSGRPLPPDEAAPLTPPVAVEPDPQPAPIPPPAPISTPAASVPEVKPAELVRSRKQKHHGKRSHPEIRGTRSAAVVVLSEAPQAPEAAQVEPTDIHGRRDEHGKDVTGDKEGTGSGEDEKDTTPPAGGGDAAGEHAGRGGSASGSVAQSGKDDRRGKGGGKGAA